jgi:hypothetical protein
MQNNLQQQLAQQRANLEELSRAYDLEPSAQLLSQIFQLQVRIQTLESSS